MAELHNLTKENVGVLEKAFDQMRAENPSATMTIFPDDNPTVEERLSRMEAKIDHIHQRLENIFGKYVLIDGKFCDIKV